MRAQTANSKRGKVRKHTTQEMVMKPRSDKCWKQCIMVNMHVCLCYLSWKHRSPFRRKPLRALVSSFSHEPKYTAYPFSEEIYGSLWGPFLLHWVLCFILKRKMVLFMKTETFNAISNSYKRCFFRSFYYDTPYGLGFTMDPYVHFVHPFPPSVMCNYMSSRFDLVLQLMESSP